MGNPKIHPHKYAQLISFGKGAKNRVNEGKYVLFTNGTEVTGDPQSKNKTKQNQPKSCILGKN